MPSPLGHALAGLTVHALTARDGGELGDRSRVALLTAAAVAPDLDLLLRLVDGRNHHQQQSHSLGAVVVATVLFWAVARVLGHARAAGLGLAAGGAWLSHVLLDYLAVDTNPPIGIMALWPLSAGYFHCPWSLFLDIGRTLEWATVRHDARAILWEVCVLLPPLVMVWRRRLRN